MKFHRINQKLRQHSASLFRSHTSLIHDFTHNSRDF